MTYVHDDSREDAQSQRATTHRAMISLAQCKAEGYRASYPLIDREGRLYEAICLTRELVELLAARSLPRTVFTDLQLPCQPSGGGSVLTDIWRRPGIATLR